VRDAQTDIALSDSSSAIAFLQAIKKPLKKISGFVG
jgi:hypothetical protein